MFSEAIALLFNFPDSIAFDIFLLYIHENEIMTEEIFHTSFTTSSGAGKNQCAHCAFWKAVEREE